MPMEEARCPQCEEPIGGHNHTPVPGVHRAEEFDAEFGGTQLFQIQKERPLGDRDPKHSPEEPGIVIYRNIAFPVISQACAPSSLPNRQVPNQLCHYMSRNLALCLLDMFKTNDNENITYMFHS